MNNKVPFGKNYMVTYSEEFVEIIFFLISHGTKVINNPYLVRSTGVIIPGYFVMIKGFWWNLTMLRGIRGKIRVPSI